MHSKMEWTALILLLVFDAILLFRTPYDASNLEIVPDSVEYAYGALHLAHGDGYQILVGGKSLTPRYPPWFSAILVPAYWMFGSEPGNAIAFVLLFALVGLMAAYEVGRSMSGIPGGVGAGILVLVATDYHYWGRQVMSDVPCTAIILVLLWLWTGMRNSGAGWRWALAGILIAVATAFRPASAAFVLPFVLFWLHRPPRRWGRLALLVAPVFFQFCLFGAYNCLSFGSFFRSGYAYWCAVPFDYRSLAYSLRYVPENLQVAGDSHVFWLLLALLPLWFIVRNRSEQAFFPAFLLFLLAGGTPLLLFYLVYFYPDSRFYLPVSALLAVGCGGLAGRVVRACPAWLVIAGQIGLTIAGAWMAMYVRSAPDLERRHAVDAVLRDTPANAAIVTAIEPAYFENFPHMENRLFIPVSRRVEYASKVLVRRRIPSIHPEPVGWWDHRCAGLLQGGAEESIAWTAYENPDRLVGLAAEDRPIFFDRNTLSGALIEDIVHRAGLPRPERCGSFDRVAPPSPVP